MKAISDVYYMRQRHRDNPGVDLLLQSVGSEAFSKDGEQ